MKRQREIGLDLIERGEAGDLCMSEWSPPPDLDPLSEEAWVYANPALGHTLDLKTIAKEAAKPDKLAFYRSGLNLWISADRAWLQPSDWGRLVTELPPLSGGVLVVDVSRDGQRFVGVRSAQVDEVTAVETAFMVNTAAEAWSAAVDPRCRSEHRPGDRL